MSTVTEIQSIIEASKPRDPDKGPCHTYPEHGEWALCGAGGGKSVGGPSGTGWHTNKQCRKRGHKKCVTCEELGRQLGEDFAVKA